MTITPMYATALSACKFDLHSFERTFQDIQLSYYLLDQTPFLCNINSWTYSMQKKKGLLQHEMKILLKIGRERTVEWVWLPLSV